jgi:hypothetical protein
MLGQTVAFAMRCFPWIELFSADVNDLYSDVSSVEKHSRVGS